MLSEVKKREKKNSTNSNVFNHRVCCGDNSLYNTNCSASRRTNRKEHGLHATPRHIGNERDNADSNADTNADTNIRTTLYTTTTALCAHPIATGRGLHSSDRYRDPAPHYTLEQIKIQQYGSTDG